VLNPEKIVVSSSYGFRKGDTVLIGGEPPPYGFWRRFLWRIRGWLHLRERPTKAIITSITGNEIAVKEADR